MNLQSCRVPLPARRCLDRAYVSVSALRFAPAPTPTPPTPTPCIACVRTYVRTYVFESVFKAVAVGALRPGMWRRSRSYVQGPPPRQHATVRTYVRTYVRPRILRCPKVINQVGGRIRTCVRIHARMYVPSRVRVASTEKKNAHVVPVRRAIVAGCASCPVCASCTRRRAHPTYVYVRTYFSMHAGTYVRT